ncbi:Gfo/Idh/MocA family protein [Streptomyces sp. NPDC056465]|uniref:Gfo/Idh/MocA family protein n=1 Tax=Streptomyces sp. NPDC056465 TaxID=3345829 RepID=UPI0036A57AD6
MKTQRFALIGAGLFGERHAQAYSRSPYVDFAAVCDMRAERAEEIATTYGAGRATTDFRDVLADPTIDAVSIATPDHLHRELAVAAAEAGKHILVEKPLATTVEDAVAIDDAARANGVKLMVDFHNRVNPMMVSAKQAIDRGDIGSPAYVYSRLSNTMAVATGMLSWASHSSALWFLASHTIDAVRWMLDDEVVRVYAVSRDKILRERGVPTADFHVATVEFASGTVAVFESAWILPDTHSTVKDLKLEILGDKGAVNIDGSHNRTLEIYTSERSSFPDLYAPPTGEHLTGFVLDAIAYFVDAVVFDKPVLATGEDGIEITRILCAIEDSVRAGMPVDLKPRTRR